MTRQVTAVTPGHQEKSIRLAWSGTSGMSGTSGRFSCQKSLSSHFFSELFSSHNYIKSLQNFYSFSQFINSFPPEYLHENSFKFVQTPTHVTLLIDVQLSLPATFISDHYHLCPLDSQTLFVQQITLTLSPPHLTTVIQYSGGNRNYQSMLPLTIATAFPNHVVCSCCLLFIS
jgi:hypothetical protein